MKPRVEDATGSPSIARRLVRGIAWSVVGLIVSGVLFAVYEWIIWPNVSALADQNPSTTAFIETYKREALAEGDTTPVRWQWIDWDRISPNMKAAVLVAEDIEFFSHRGFSMPEIWAAISEAWKTGAPPRGASTLTQQLAKNLWLSPSRNPFRKVKEALLTMQLEASLSKERVFELYLNVAEFGPGIYGVGAAATAYFSKSAEDLTRSEAALLAASLPRPSSWNPTSNSIAYRTRAGRIEDLMAQYRDFLQRHVGFVWNDLRATSF